MNGCSYLLHKQKPKMFLKSFMHVINGHQQSFVHSSHPQDGMARLEKLLLLCTPCQGQFGFLTFQSNRYLCYTNRALPQGRIGHAEERPERPCGLTREALRISIASFYCRQALPPWKQKRKTSGCGAEPHL